MKTANISLTSELLEIIRRLKRRGRYANTSEICRAGLRLLEKTELHDYLDPEPLPPGTLEAAYRRQSKTERQAERAAARASIRTFRRMLKRKSP